MVFALTLIPPGALGTAFGFPWLLLGLAVPDRAGRAPRAARCDCGADFGADLSADLSGGSGLVLLGVLALRAAIIFSIQ